MSEETQVVVPPSSTHAPGVNLLPAILLPLAGPEEFDLEVGQYILSPDTHWCSHWYP